MDPIAGRKPLVDFVPAFVAAVLCLVRAFAGDFRLLGTPELRLVWLNVIWHLLIIGLCNGHSERNNWVAYLDTPTAMCLLLPPLLAK